MEYYRESDPTSPDNLRYVERGVLWLADETTGVSQPAYIIDKVIERNEHYVMVFEPEFSSEAGLTIPVKSKELVKEVSPYSDKTRFGQLANKFLFRPKKKRYKEANPIYVAPIVAEQTDTFSGLVDDGFYDREKDKWATDEKGNPYIKKGESTGVFIGLKRVQWEGRVKVNPADILDGVRRTESDEYMTFHDFEGGSDYKSTLTSYYDKLR